MVNLMLLVMIYSEGNDKKINSILNKYGIKIKTITSASGTASPSVLDYFGLMETKKNVYLAIIPQYDEYKILNKLKNTFTFDKVGTGITFTIPISSSNKSGMSCIRLFSTKSSIVLSEIFSAFNLTKKFVIFPDINLGQSGFSHRYIPPCLSNLVLQ